MPIKYNKFIFATGGTGGHIFPAVSVYQHIKKISPETKVIFVISSRPNEEMILKNYNCSYKVLPMKPLPSSFKGWPRFFISFFRSFIKSFKVLSRYNPDLVVGFGCYVSVPMVLAAFLKRKKIVLHEQNVRPSKSNLLLKRFARLVLLSFDDSEKFFSENETVITGNPLREELNIVDRKKAALDLKIGPDSFNILVIGGSQGARIFNEVVPAAVSLLPQEYKQKISILHLSGRDALDVGELYQKSRVNIQVRDFLNEMGTAFSSCDLAIARAGALTLSELAFFGVPAILVPYVYDNGFQLENADYYIKRQAAFILEEKNFNPQNLKNLLESLMQQRDKLLFTKQKILGLRKISAAKQFSDIILNLIN